jgi:hypothetical protein
MGRTSKLTEKQWESIGKRLLDGESARSLGREFGVAESAIRKRLSAQVGQVKTVANQLVETERAFNALPISAQISARTLANRLLAISDHLAGAAEYGAATAHRLSGIAHMKANEIDDAKPLDAESLESLRGIAALTKMANDASEIGVNLLRANKEAVDGLSKPEDKEVPTGLNHFYGDTAA